MQEAKAGATPVLKVMYMCPWEEEAGNAYVSIAFKDASNFSYHIYRGWVRFFTLISVFFISCFFVFVFVFVFENCICISLIIFSFQGARDGRIHDGRRLLRNLRRQT